MPLVLIRSDAARRRRRECHCRPGHRTRHVAVDRLQLEGLGHRDRDVAARLRAIRRIGRARRAPHPRRHLVRTRRRRCPQEGRGRRPIPRQLPRLPIVYVPLVLIRRRAARRCRRKRHRCPGHRTRYVAVDRQQLQERLGRIDHRERRERERLRTDDLRRHVVARRRISPEPVLVVHDLQRRRVGKIHARVVDADRRRAGPGRRRRQIVVGRRRAKLETGGRRRVRRRHRQRRTPRHTHRRERHGDRPRAERRQGRDAHMPPGWGIGRQRERHRFERPLPRLIRHATRHLIQIPQRVDSPHRVRPGRQIHGLKRPASRHRARDNGAAVHHLDRDAVEQRLG